MSQQQYDEYGVLIRPRPSQQQVQTVDDYGVPIKKKVGGGISSTASDIVATPSESPSNLPSGLQESGNVSIFPTKGNFMSSLTEPPKTVTTFDGTQLTISPDDKSPYANSLHQSAEALNGLQQRVLSKTPTPLDLEVLSQGSGKSVAATQAYITKGKDVGTATDINDNTQSTEQFLKNSISGLSKEMGAVNNPDEIANNPDEGASFLSKLHTAIKATQGMSGYLQGVVPFVKSAYDVAENLLSGKVDKDKLATDVQQLSENAGTKVEDKQKAFVAQAQKALPVLVKNITDQTAKEAFDKGIEDSQAIDLLYKRLDPESYEKSVEMRNATPQSASTKVGTSILNGVAAIKNFSDWVTNADENNKELLNAEKGQYELLLNRGLGNYAAQLKAKGISTGDQQLIEQANTLIPKIQDESAIVEKYPMLIKQQMADYINQRYAEETGILNGTEVQGANGRLLKYGGVNTDVAKRYLREGGFYDKPNFKDYADDVAEHPATYLATGNTVAGAPMQFLNVFKSIFNSVADLEGFRTAEDRHAENIKSQMFPSELTQNIKPDISFDLGGHHFETTVAKTLNGVAHLGGYMATAALGSAIGGTAGLSGSAAARVGAWSSFGADAIDSGLKTADQLGLTPAQSWLYAGMNAVMMSEGGRLLEFGKGASIPQIPGVNQKIADAAIGLTNKTLTEGAAKELVDGAVNTWAGALKKWGIGTAKGAGVMTAFGVGDKMLRVAAGDPNANLNDILPEAANAYFDGVLTMGVIGGFGLPADIAKAKNSTYKAALSSIVDNHDAAKDILQIGLDRGLFSKQEYDQKVAVLNTGLKAKASLNGAIAKTGVSIDGKQRQTWIANATAEKVLRDQAEKEGVSQEEAAQYIKQADALKEQNGKIFNGLKFSKLLEPQYNLYDAQLALNEAQKTYAENPTPENEQVIADKKAIFDKFNENYQNGIPESKANKEATTEAKVPVTTEEASPTNEAVDNVSKEAEAGTFEDKVRALYPALKNTDDAGVNDFVKENATDSPSKFIKEFGEDKFNEVVSDIPIPDLKSKLKIVKQYTPNSEDVNILDKAISAKEDEAIYGKKGEPRIKLDFTESKPIVEPPKPISEMNSEEIGNYATEVRQALKQHEKEFENKTEAEKEAGGYYDYIDNVAELRDTEQRVNFVENAENLDDLANSTKAALRDFNKDNPSQESLAILNAAKKKSAEMNIEPETLIKEVIKKVGNDYKDKNDAEFMMRNYLEKIVPTEPQAEQQPIVNSNSEDFRNSISHLLVEPNKGRADLLIGNEDKVNSIKDAFTYTTRGTNKKRYKVDVDVYESKNGKRYIARDKDGTILSSAFVDKDNKLTGIITDRGFENVGIGTNLYREVLKDNPKVKASGVVSKQGQKLLERVQPQKINSETENKPTISKEQDKKGSESEELGVGTKWDSPSGKKEITGSVMVGNVKQFTISIDGKHSNELIKVADLQKDIARDKSDLIHREEARKEGDITRDKEAKKQEFYNNTNGFADGKSPMEKAKILKVLNTEQLYNGKLKVRKTFIEDAVANGGTVKEVNGKKRLYYNDNRFIDNLTKTEYDYADYLNQIKNKPKEQTEPTTKGQPEQEVTIGRNEIKGLNNSVNNGLEQDNKQAINYLNQSLKKDSNIDFEGVSTSEGAATKVTGVTNKGGARVEKVNSNSLELNFRNKSTGNKVNQVLHFKTEEDLNKAVDFIYSKHKDREIQQYDQKIKQQTNGITTTEAKPAVSTNEKTKQASEPTNKVENNSKNKQTEVPKPRTQSPLPTKEEISKYSAKDKLALVNAVRNKDAKAIQEITERNRGGNTKLDKGDYRLQHRINGDIGSTSSLDNLIKSGNGENLVPEDLYSHPEYYADMKDKAYKESWEAIKKAKGNPEAEVTIYRSVPKGIKKINEGDWVSLSPTYAKQEGLHPTDESKDNPVISKKVKVKDVRWDGNDINEFGYFPEGKSKADKVSSEIKTDEGTMPVEQYVSRAKAVLEKLFPKAKFEAYDTTADYLDAGGTYGSKGLSRVDGKGNRTIMLDLQEIRDSGSGKTAFHEVIHPIVDEVVGEHPEELNPLWNSLASQMKDVEGFDKVLLHVMNYGAHEHPAAEGITELLTQISEGNISLDKVPPTRRGAIIDLLNKIFEKLGLSIRFGDQYDFKSFATDIKKAFETGDTESLKSVVDKKLEENQRAKDNASKISKFLFGDKADKSETDINDVVKQLRELGLTDKEIEEGLKQSGDSEADIKRALGGGGKSGNVGETEGLGQGDGNAITHAAIDDFRREMGFEPFAHVRMTDAEVNAKADKAIADGYNVQNLFHDIAEGHNPNEVEVVILKKTKAAIDDAVNKNPSKSNLKKAADFANASDVAGQIAGRAFRLRQDIDDVDVTKQSLGDFFVTRMRNKGVTPETITDAQKSEIQKQYNDLKDAHDKLEQKVAKLVEADAKKKAESAVKKMKDRASSQPKKTHDDYVKERKSLVEQLKAAKEKAEERMKGITKSGFSITITPEMAKIIGKIAFSHVSEGAQKLQEVSQKVYNEIKDVFEGVTQQDVVDVLAGAYNAVKPEKNDILKQIAALRSEAIKESSLAKERKDAQRLKTIKKTYQGKIDKLKEDLRTGKYLQEKDKPEPLKLDKEALALKDQYISIKQETQRLIAKDEYNKKSKAEKAKINALEALNIPRTIMSSSDFSAVLRQAVVPSVTHPIMALKSMKGMFADAFSEKKFDRWLFDLKESPLYDEMNRSGVYISDPHDMRLSKKEEAYMNNIVERIPYIGSWLVKGSERAYLSYLNRMRVELYGLGSDVMARNGKTIENSAKDFEGLASFVNNMTGRGGVPEKMELATPLISAGIFAPRLIASRLNLLGLSDITGNGFYSKLPPEVRKMAITDMAKFVMFGSAVLALSSLVGDDKKNKTVELDPRSSDFGKIRVGDTRYDIWGGFQQYVTFFARQLTGVSKSVNNGKIYDLNGKGAFGRTRWDTFLSFARGKASPAVGMGIDFLAGGRTVVGDKILYNKVNPFADYKKKEVPLGSYLANHFFPMTSGDIYDAVQSGDMRNLFAIPATIFGISVQTFNDKK